MRKTLRYITLLLLAVLGLSASAQTPKQNKSVLAYIEKYKDLAMEEMILNQVPASIKLAQGIVESEHGNGDLARKSNNHFGIKCHTWQGKKIYKKDDNPDDCFRVYESVEESYRDHSSFLRKNSRYAFLFDLEINDYVNWAKGLKKAGYATDKDYASKLIRIIKDYELFKYDQMVLRGKFKIKNKPQTPPAPKDTPAASDPSPAQSKPAKAAMPTAIMKKKAAKHVKTAPAFATCPVVEMTSDKHDIRENFGVKFIITKADDNIYDLAKELKMNPSQLRKYNDLPKTKQTFSEGEILYIGPKRFRAASGYSAHIVKQGETLSQISRIYAVRLKRLFKMNGLDENSIIHVGDTIILR